MLRAAIALAVGLTTVPAYAQVLRCLDPEGKIEYRSSPCPADTRERVVDARSATDETSAGVTNTAVRRRTENSTERKRALDAAERYGAVARAARPQVPVEALPPPPGK
jgi:hypothetical protein